MKLTEYADAGIPGYWLIDLDPPADLTAYALVDGDYEIAAAGPGPLSLLSPVEIRIDLDRLVARR
jgi:Uma2 family endonuclease